MTDTLQIKATEAQHHADAAKSQLAATSDPFELIQLSMKVSALDGLQAETAALYEELGDIIKLAVQLRTQLLQGTVEELAQMKVTSLQTATTKTCKRLTFIRTKLGEFVAFSDSVRLAKHKAYLAKETSRGSAQFVRRPRVRKDRGVRRAQA